MKILLLIFEKTIQGSALNLFLLINLLIFSVQAYGQEQAPKEEITDDVVIYFEATRCYGTCPVFIYKIFEDGNAQYFGKEFVKNEGFYETTVSSEDMEELVEIFEKYNFFDYKDRYTEHVSDLPTVYVYFSHDGQSKKITDYYGAPESLKEMEKEIVEKLRSLDWNKSDENRLENIQR